MDEQNRLSQQTKHDREIVIHELDEKNSSRKSVPAAEQHKRIVIQKLPVQPPKPVIPEKKPQKKVQQETNIFPKHPDHFWLKTIPFFIVILLLGLVVVIHSGLYNSKTLAPLAKSLARFLHYPVAFVGTSIISYPQFEQEEKLVKQYYNAEQQLSNSSIPSETVMSAIAYNKLIRATVLLSEFKKRNISVSPDELEAGFVYMFGTPSSDQNSVQIVRLFNQTPDQFKSTYLKDFLLQAKLSAQLQQDSTRIQRKAQQIQQLHTTVVAHPEQFGSLAKQTNNDATAAISGDLGFISSSQIPQPFSALVSLSPKAISDIFETNDGYYIFQAIEIIPEQRVDQAPFVIHIRQIVVHKDTATSFADEQLLKRHVVILDPTLTWSSICTQVLPQSGGSCTPQFLTNQLSFSAVVDSLSNTTPPINSHFSPSAP